jgi:hypothetical protein
MTMCSDRMLESPEVVEPGAGEAWVDRRPVLLDDQAALPSRVEMSS